MKNYLLSSKCSCYLFSFSPKGSEISISFPPWERILYFLISFYTFYVPLTLVCFLQEEKKIKVEIQQHVHWNENTEDRKNSLFPQISLGNFGVICVRFRKIWYWTTKVNTALSITRYHILKTLQWKCANWNREPQTTGL